MHPACLDMHSALWWRSVTPELYNAKMGNTSDNKKWDRVDSLIGSGDTIDQAAFRRGDEVYPTGPLHLISKIPGGFTQDIEAGFVTKGGHFLSREEAGRMTGRRGIVTGEQIQKDNAEEAKTRHGLTPDGMNAALAEVRANPGKPIWSFGFDRRYIDDLLNAKKIRLEGYGERAKVHPTE